MHDISFRKAEQSDAKELARIQREAFLPLFEKYGDEDSPANVTVEEMSGKIENPYGKYFVIASDGVTVGGVYAYFTDRTMNEVCLCSIYVLPAFQGRGIAQEAIRFIEKQYPDNVGWVLNVPVKEEKNIHLYEKMGYIRTDMTEVINDALTLVTYIKRAE